MFLNRDLLYTEANISFIGRGASKISFYIHIITPDLIRNSSLNKGIKRLSDCRREYEMFQPFVVRGVL